MDADNDEDDNDNNDNHNNAADALVGTTITVAVDANTRVEFKTTGTLIGPNVGDTAKVKAEMCGTPATFTADKVKAKGAKSASSSDLKRSSKHHGSKSHK